MYFTNILFTFTINVNGGVTIYKKFFLLLTLLFSFFLLSCEEKNPTLKVHFIDVGQGDSSLIQFNDINILIDSSSNENKERLLKYLKNQKITTIDYLIATHPHEDHIGNMDSLIKSFDISNFLAPKVTTDSSEFKSVLKASNKKDLSIIPIDSSTEDIILNDDCKLRFLSPAPNTSYENLNNYSIVSKLEFKNISFLFTGDSESLIENTLLDKDIDSTVLKVAHHGSSTSSTLDFIKKVNPSISIISCGINNKFNHPSEKTLNNLNTINSLIYRTDEDGSIVLESNGSEIIKR